MKFFGKTNIDFMGKRNRWYLISLAVIVVGLVSIPLKGGLNYGIDFTGGTELVVQFQQAPNVGEVRSAVTNAGFANVEVKTFGTPERIMIRTETQGAGTTVTDKMRETLDKSFGSLHPTLLQEQKIGPKVGKELRRDAFYAVIASLIAISIYVGFRFKFIYGIGAIVSLLHDVLVVLGLVSLVNGTTSLTNFEFDQNMIAAFLTLVGLSINDTVVIFDRIRENQKTYKTMSLFDLMNKSLNETLSRTIITSGTIFMVTIVLYLLGGEVNRGFAFAMTIGIVTGTYSSIYIASAIVLDYTNMQQRKRVQPSAVGKPTYETAK